MNKLIIDCSTGKKTVVEMTPEEEVQRLAETKAALLVEEIEQEKEQKRKDAIERLKKSADKNVIDLLKAIGLAD